MEEALFLIAENPSQICQDIFFAGFATLWTQQWRLHQSQYSVTGQHYPQYDNGQFNDPDSESDPHFSVLANHDGFSQQRRRELSQTMGHEVLHHMNLSNQIQYTHEQIRLQAKQCAGT